MKPWAEGSFELLRHAEEHVRGGSDFDRRMALISFDNSIEVAIFTYLSLNPIQRDNTQFPKEQVAKWLTNFHSKLEFLEFFVTVKLVRPMEFQRDEIVFYHNLRNEIYHQGTGVTPDARYLNGIRTIALWVFKTLFGFDPEPHLAISEVASNTKPIEVDSTDSSNQNLDLSDQTKFLESFISIRHDLNMLMRMMRGESSSDTTELPASEAWKNISGSAEEGAYNDLLERAETLRTKIVEGDSDTDESAVRELSQRLVEVSDLINSELRPFQRDIVEKALEATARIAADSGPRRVGIVWQTPGTGITGSLISYVTRVTAITALDNPLIIVASNVNSLIDQTYSRFVRSAGSLTADLERVTDSDRLLRLINSTEKKIILTTFQRVLRIGGQAPFERRDILFVGHDLYDTSGRINRTFPNAAFILFTNTFLPTNEMGSTYGELIARYDFRQAVDDQVSSPIHYEHRRVAQGLHDDSSGGDTAEFFTVVARLDYIHDLAADLVEHFESHLTGGERAVILTRRIDLANALFAAVLRRKPQWAEDVIGPLTVAVEPSQRQSFVSRLIDRQDKFKIALISSGLLSGLDIRNVRIVYVVETLSSNVLLKAFGLLGRNSDGKPGLIVDYGPNLHAVQSLLYEENTESSDVDNTKSGSSSN